MFEVRRCWQLVLMLVLFPAMSYAQATIAGSVRDTSGAVLPGVTVEASSPALIEKVRSVTSDGAGQFQIIDLRPGTYSVTFTLPGFNTVKRDGVELSGSFMREGYLRSNGVPYSASAVLTEYFDTFTHTNGQEWLVVTSVVEDPVYLLQAFVTTSHFKRERDGSRWRPTPCEIVPPTRGPRPVPPTGYRAQQPRG